MHCWCPPATGPGQSHLSDCAHYKRSGTWTVDGGYVPAGLPAYDAPKKIFFAMKYQSKLSQLQTQAYKAQTAMYAA